MGTPSPFTGMAAVGPTRPIFSWAGGRASMVSPLWAETLGQWGSPQGGLSQFASAATSRQRRSTRAFNLGRRPEDLGYTYGVMAKSASSRSKAVRSAYEKSRRVDPRPITGREQPGQLLEHAFAAYVGRQERLAFELMRRSVFEDCAVFLTLSGAMTPAGLHQSCLIPLIERGIVDCITTTGANLYHDAHRVIGHRIREIEPNAGDLSYRLARIIRIYDLGFWEETLLETDRLFSAILQKPELQKRMTTVELHSLLGKNIAAMEEALGVKSPSLLSTAYRRKVPIF